MAARDTIAAWTDAVAPRLRRHVTAGTRTHAVLRRARGALRRPAPHAVARLVFEYARHRPDARFVQVGSNDGIQLDPLRTEILFRRWRGVMVEPVPYVFDRLVANYGHLDHLAFENLAIADRDGEAEFHYLPEADGDHEMPEWYDAIGSFRRDVVLSHSRFIADIEARIATMTVPTSTFDALCARHGIESLDVVQVDTEGYDWEIVRRIDLDRYRPELVLYENLHLGADDRAACEAHLRAHGFALVSNGMDTLALHHRVLAERPRLRALVAVAASSPEVTDVSGVPDGDAGHGSTPVAGAAARGRRAARRALDRVLRTRGLRLAGIHADDGEPVDEYLRQTHDESWGLPPGTDEALRPDHPRLLELRRRYAALDWPVVVHSRWNDAVVGEWLDLRWFRGDYAYVWHYRESRRVSELKYLLFLDHVASRDARGLLDVLDEDGAFGCWTYEYPGRPTASRDLLDAVLELGFLDREARIYDTPGLRVLDIGAGYGRLAHRAAASVPDLARWTCVDAIPESTFLAEHYTRFRGVQPPVEVVPLDEVPDLEPGSFDLATNVHSFSECTLGAIRWWLHQLVRLDVPRLFLVPNEPEGFRSTETDGSGLDYLPALTEAGFHLVAEEPAFTDPAVRAMLQVDDRYCLFERR